MTFGGIEAGGTKWVCALSERPGAIDERFVFPTTTPAETLARACEVFLAADDLVSLGIGSFGPIDLDSRSPAWGSITTTPKPGWQDVDVVGPLRAALQVPVAFDTDVNAAALGELCFGAAVGLDTFVYLTVGTGIGGGVVVGGQLVHGLLHPELGHLRIPHDRLADPFAGACPYHGDCFEGLASGEAARQRWQGASHEVWDDAMLDLEAEYLALGLINVVATVSPRRLILGGGVMKQPGLLERVRERLRELAGGYFPAAQLDEQISSFVVAPGLGDDAGVVGAIELGRRLLRA